LAHMSISTYLRPNIHQNGPEILGVKLHTDSMTPTPCSSQFGKICNCQKGFSRLGVGGSVG
jgi:hypothetical protein